MKRNIRSAVATAVLAGVGACFLASDAIAQTTPAPQPSICSRACWTATNNNNPTQNSTLTHAIIHHTAGSGHFNTSGLNASKSNVRGIQNYHKNSLGWLDIGYNFLVDKFGNAFEGRKNSISSRPRGAHDGVNVNSIGVCILGYFHSPHNQQPPTAMRGRVYDIIAWKMPSGWSPYGTATYGGATRRKVGGHRDVKSTACPGDTMYNPYIGTNANGGEARNGIANRRTPSSTTITVGNHQSGFSASSNWGLATWCSDKHGADYRWRNTAAVSDAATFTASLPSSGSWKVYAWWCVGGNRASAAPYLIDHNGGVATVTRDQRSNGGKFNLLGTFNINSGSRKVRLSCWTSSGDVVVADAVRWVK